jgi:hypothetical protein
MLPESTYRKQLIALCCTLMSFIITTAQPTNAIKEENLLAGNPASEWDITGSGDPTIQGFATDISYNKGQTAVFKIKTNASAYTINIYRLGYYGGLGARLVGTGTVTATLPQVQPDPLQDAPTGLVDCGNWEESATWAIPANAVSGYYIAKLIRSDNSGASHIVFIVRDDASNSDLFFQASDATWHAYNNYGGNSLYNGVAPFPGGHAAKVSYNRPLVTRGGGGGSGIAGQDWLFNAEYPMIRFLERNGYDVTYTTNVDAARFGSLILNHKIFLSVGHDEYWSAEQRTNVTAARNAGVHLAFFSGNEVYWKTRWENSTDVSGTPFRTLVCYKEGTNGEGICGEKCDPTNMWTGLWRDGCGYAGVTDACLPENALTGQISWSDITTSLTVPAAYKNLRFWRNTTIPALAPEGEAIFPYGTLGFEVSFENSLFQGSYPAGRITMSSTALTSSVHKLSLYRHSSGALVFGAGTAQWAWGLDNVHDLGSLPADVRMQQATVNLFADMGAQPTSIQFDLIASTISTDFTAPNTTINIPPNGASVFKGVTTTISGTSADAGGGVTAGIEISLDGGLTWRPAIGAGHWSYSWTPTIPGVYTIKVRGIDDSGNIEIPGSVPSSNAITITVLDNLDITSTSPLNFAAQVSPTAQVRATFSQNINPATVDGTTFQLKDANNNVVTATLSVLNNQATLFPSSPLTNSAVYTAFVKGGISGIKSIDGDPLALDSTWTFTVADPTPLPPTEGPGGPILVISSAANPFSRYPVEILRAEGLNEFAAQDIATVDATVLNNYDVVILGEMPISPAQATLFTDWVTAGGTLIASRPSDELSSLLGITKVAGTLDNKYLLVNTGSAPGTGIVGETIQYHGTSDQYSLNGASSVAALYSDANTATVYHAITSMNVGSNGGKAIAFSFDLPKSIVYTRQGNPAWAGQNRDPFGPIRSNDMFFGTGGDPHWIDFNKVAIPQADEQQRLLANMILQGNLHRKPLPRFWYLPRSLKAAIVMTGDDHNNNGTIPRFNQYLTLGPNTPQDVADWKAVRSTSYIYPGTSMTNAQAMMYESQGFEIALHPTTNCVDYPSMAFLQNTFTTQLAQLAAALPGISAPVTSRTHCLLWSDWATTAKVEVQKGMRMDATYYYWPVEWMANIPGMFTGSGFPMRFADTDGTMIDNYQLATQITDETGANYTTFVGSLLDKATGPEGYYGVFNANIHTDYHPSTGSDEVVAAAQARNIPIISAKQMLTWVDGRNNSSFSSIAWNGTQLSFTITAMSGARNLKGMLPLFSVDGTLNTITRNGSPIAFNSETIKGIQYVFFDAASGAYVATYGPTATGNLSGTVVLQGRPAAPHALWEVPLQVDLYAPGNNTTPAFTYNVTTGTSGEFVVTGIPIGTYTITVKNIHTLKKIQTGQVITTGGNLSVNFGTLLEGDANNNNVVNLSDLGLLLSSYNKLAGDPAYLPNADLNGNGVVNLSDLGLLLSNYNTVGPNP